MNREVLEKLVIEDKISGLSDEEIGNKYKVNLKFIEKAITKEKGINLSKLKTEKKINKLEPKDFSLEKNSIWSFKSRGNWATHNGSYRGNWSPYIPRNIILRYSNEKDLVLDYFCGAGTTAVEAKLLNRDFIGIDINEKAVELAKENLTFDSFNDSQITLKVGDARNLNDIKDNSIDLICSHPPYADIINYTHNNLDDLSHLSVNDFLKEIKKVALESYRVLKPEKYCAILIGDMRKNKHVIPLGFWTIEKYIEAGFNIKELIIKRQHNCKTTGFWYKNSIKFNFLLLAHEYLVVFKKTDDLIQPERKGNCKVSYTIFDDVYLESTTVWIFNKEDYESKLISNLAKRYSTNFCVFNDQFKSDSDLIIYFYDNRFNDFCEKIEKAKCKSVFAIVCEDERVKDLIYSNAISVEKYFRENKNFKIKEIVIVNLTNIQSEKEENNNLNITHKYVLIYQKVM